MSVMTPATSTRRRRTNSPHRPDRISLAEPDLTPHQKPKTGTGVSRARVVPSPIWPWSLDPQQSPPPDERQAQLCEEPAASSTASRRSETVTGSTTDPGFPLPSEPAHHDGRGKAMHSIPQHTTESS